LKRLASVLAAAASLVLAPAPAAAHGDDDHEAAAAGLSEGGARFEPPPPGSYALPAFGRVGRHTLLDPAGEAAALLDIAADEVAFVSFVYLRCPDACPIATATLQRLDRDLAADPPLAGRVSLVTLSFDPDRDTPEAMARYARSVAPLGRWRFLTASDAADVAAVLEDFGQDAAPLVGPDGVDTGLLSHVLKVFLVDGQGRIRNAYSTGFLDVRVLRNDAVTVLGETAGAGP
jgi:cytochrome oxidase Cu insertion factor (SCO1/SenC/PrrC family)